MSGLAAYTSIRFFLSQVLRRAEITRPSTWPNSPVPAIHSIADMMASRATASRQARPRTYSRACLTLDLRLGSLRSRAQDSTNSIACSQRYGSSFRAAYNSRRHIHGPEHLLIIG